MEDQNTTWTCPQRLIDFTETYIKQSINIDPWYFAITKDSFVTRFVENMLIYGKNVSKSEREYRKWISEHAKTLSITFLYNDGLAEKVIRDECSIEDVLRQNDNYKIKNKRIFDDITSHHTKLKTFGWSEITVKPTDLQQYARAANVMGEKVWVAEANKWMESFVLDYFRHSGAKKAFIKTRKRQRVDQYRSSLDIPEDSSTLPPTILSSLAQMKNYYEIALPDDICTQRKIRLLDVGSCYNPFIKSPNADSFDVTALDLQPVNSTVFQCDFLKLEVGSSFRTQTIDGEIVTASSSNSSDEAVQSFTRLLELPAEGFDAITMSLVLSYLPTPQHRREMISKARALLTNSNRTALESKKASAELNSSDDANGVSSTCYPGVLVIAEKASIFGVNSGRKQSGEGCDSIHMTLRRSWINAICNEGFELLQYKDIVLTRHHVHVFAFKAVERQEAVLLEEGRLMHLMLIKSEVNKSSTSSAATTTLADSGDKDNDGLMEGVNEAKGEAQGNASLTI